MFEKFFYLIRLSIGTEEVRPGMMAALSAQDWLSLWILAKRQAMAGIFFGGIEKLPAEERPPREVLMPWIAVAERVKAANRFLNRRAAEVSARLRADGWRHCILKGQGVATFYPEPLLRQPGDIDVWMMGARRDVLRYLEDRYGRMVLCYLHADAHGKGAEAVEYHFTPSFATSPFRNRRLQQWFAAQADAQAGHYVDLPEGAGEIPVPTQAFNEVYMLHHIYRHLFSEGIGLRQVCDYAVLLMRREGTEGTAAMLRRLGLEDFARGLAWILMSCFHLPESNLYCAPDGRQGRFIFNEIMRSGNFGQYDARFNPLPQGAGKLRRACHKARRNFSFVRSYPGEVVWYLPFMAWETLRYKLPHR